jgi:hypothetical protein
MENRRAKNPMMLSPRAQLLDDLGSIASCVCTPLFLYWRVGEKNQEEKVDNTECDTQSIAPRVEREGKNPLSCGVES